LPQAEKDIKAGRIRDRLLEKGQKVQSFSRCEPFGTPTRTEVVVAVEE
jgi:hypothetical protein